LFQDDEPPPVILKQVQDDEPSPVILKQVQDDDALGLRKQFWHGLKPQQPPLGLLAPALPLPR
jgi:hypothetical protein